MSVSFLWIGLAHNTEWIEMLIEVVAIALYVRENITSRQIFFKNGDEDMERFFVVINLRMKKQFISCSYNSHLKFIDKHLTRTRKELTVYQANMVTISEWVI